MCPSFQGKPFREKCQEHEHVIEWQTDHFNEGSACREACLELMRPKKGKYIVRLLYF